MMKRFILSSYTSEEQLISALESLNESHIKVFDVFMPYPVHEVDGLLGIKRSRLPIVCFFAGMCGFLMALGFQMWVSNLGWPIIVGGKPFNSVPAFMPVTFELTVLLGGLVTVAVFFFRSKLFPGKKALPISTKTTDHTFVIAIESADATNDEGLLKKILTNSGAQQVVEKEMAL